MLAYLVQCSLLLEEFTLLVLTLYFPVFSGCRNGRIHLHDVRKANHCTGTAVHHQMEVCGLRWSPDGLFLASGGNDNLVCVWSPRSGTEEPAQLLTGHQAAVKVLNSKITPTQLS